jgi:hypothetical protein
VKYWPLYSRIKLLATAYSAELVLLMEIDILDERYYWLGGRGSFSFYLVTKEIQFQRSSLFHKVTYHFNLI